MGCSTPFGILYVGTPTAMPALQPRCTCSTPFGILYVGTRQRPQHPQGKLRAQRLSASYMSERRARQEHRLLQICVLNAFRHLICRNEDVLEQEIAAGRAQRLSASYMSEQPTSKRLVLLEFFRLSARTPFCRPAPCATFRSSSRSRSPSTGYFGRFLAFRDPFILCISLFIKNSGS